MGTRKLLIFFFFLRNVFFFFYTNVSVRSRFEMCAAAFGHVRAHLRGNIGGDYYTRAERRGKTLSIQREEARHFF